MAVPAPGTDGDKDESGDEKATPTAGSNGNEDGDDDSVVQSSELLSAASQGLHSEEILPVCVDIAAGSSVTLADEADDLDEEELATMTPPDTKSISLAAQACVGRDA
jgi:hypothetical protein